MAISQASDGIRNNKATTAKYADEQNTQQE